ncbi:histidine kinase [Streptomyces sp. ST2-7A]|uniref:sensor histidine kinase n=1 Tax=Streptomyces sp. ST2-7A TaxID=2907214 RepID=UPI001F285AB2|nr:histidine kinase [Streptomyces sp. ST2-7A]MCE7081532.1 histidine kinase [Streptomyces sp. ST2-7A]
MIPPARTTTDPGPSDPPRSPAPERAAPGVRPVARLLRPAGHPLLSVGLTAVTALAVILLLSATVLHYPKGGNEIGFRSLPPHTVLFALLACAALVARCRHPRAVLAVTVPLALVEWSLTAALLPDEQRNNALVVAPVIALFSVAAGIDRPAARRSVALALPLLLAGTLLLGPRPWYAADNVAVLAWGLMAVAAGEAVRSRRAVVRAIRERAERAERTREEEARRRVAEERLRIARELHDVVAHTIALITVQAGVASHLMDSRPDRAREALAHVREAGRRALTELNGTVEVLRRPDEPSAPTRPAGGSADLGELVEDFTRAGMRVSVRGPAPGPALPVAVDLAVHRVVREALTNVHKHAGATARATVRLSRSGAPTEPRLTIEVLDEGPPESGAEPPGGPVPSPSPEAVPHRPVTGGHGLTGMRERAAALGGTCVAGPRPDGGFRVLVTLPLRPPTAGGAETGAGERRLRCLLPCCGEERK